MQLRDYQIDLKNGAYSSWRAGHRNVALVSPTGSGKTVTMASIAHDMGKSPGVVIAHRVELVGQISATLARFGIYHQIIGPASTVKYCIQKHIREVSRSYVSKRSIVTVAAVDTLVARADKLSQWATDQRWWMIDECHHVLRENKWGAAVGMFHSAYGIGVTATPLRADRKSLHADQGGVFSDMIVGPTMRELISRGSLCDYRIFAPTNSIDTADLKIGSTGDYSQPGLRAAAHKSRIVGDIVESYKRIAMGKRGITFVVDVEQAVETAKAFNEAGVPAMAVHAKTDDTVRDSAVQKLASGKVLQLVNVDLFGEGFDVPVVEVVSMGRPTMSYGLFVQQFGRALRPFEGKSHGIIIDHVSNVKLHGLPDAKRTWSLYAEERGRKREKDPDDIKVSTCVSCFQVFQAVTRTCPYCGHTPEPVGRDRPEQVDGDLTELTPEVLAAMRGEIERVDGDPQIPFGATPIVEASVRKRWRERQEAQRELRETIALWAGYWKDRGAGDPEIHRRFWHLFDTDVMTAQTLGASEAGVLMERIKRCLQS